MSFILWSGSQANLVICWLLPQTLGYHCPSTSFTQCTIVYKVVCSWLGSYGVLVRAFSVVPSSKTLEHRRKGCMWELT